jgi:hypothetical protein
MKRKEKMMKIETGGPAFPGQCTDETGFKVEGAFYHGITILDYFAAKAMQVVYADWFYNRHFDDPNSGATISDDRPCIAEDSYAMAQAMLAERKRLSETGGGE